ncbi:MAG: FhaA domain-containing protein [Thermoleophilaceae bacterium]|jgi:hypothetical protein
MSLLRTLESKIEGLVEGTFGRVFKSNVQPVELARKLAKEMDSHRAVSVSRVYVPNRYSVWLSPGDREQFETYEAALKKELSDYLLEHARKEGLAVVTRPRIDFETDERLKLGEFGIQAQMVQPPEDESAEPRQGDLGHTMVYSPNAPEARELAPSASAERALLVGDGKRTVLSGDRLVLGRSRECDVVIDDPNVSRRHAEVHHRDGGWVVHDLGSTNGIKVNGRRVEEAPLSSGDEISLGLANLTFETE